MLHKRKNHETVSEPSPREGLAPAGADAKPSAAPALPQTAAETRPVPAPAIAPGPAKPASVSAAAHKPGPGRPPSRPQCLRCHKRVERCKCKEGALLSPQLEKAAAEEQAPAETPLAKDEAETILRFCLWLLGIGQSGIAAVVSTLTWDEAQECWSFDDSDVEKLLPAAHRVLAKHAKRIPAWLRNNGDEIALLMALYNVEQAKAARAQALIDTKMKRELRPSPREEKPAAPAPAQSLPRTAAPVSVQ